MSPASKSQRTRTGVLLVLFFVSGAAALIYEVLWLKELGLLFGVTAYAAATTLAVFFLGLSAGSLVWGRRSALIERPLRVYAFLELAIAISALAYFWLLDLYRLAFPALFQMFGDQPAVMTLVKLVLAIGILFLPAFFMGGTLPVMGQYLVRSPAELGRKASALYAINTFGGALGALAAGFYLPQLLGFRASYGLAIGLNLLVFAVAFWWSLDESRPESESRFETETGRQARPEPVLTPGLVWILAFASGFLTLALEVLWTRMFSQVLQNSVYTFAAILTVFLVALACGSVLAHFLSRRSLRPGRVLVLLLLASTLAVLAVPYGFFWLTSGLEQLGSDLGWGRYVATVFGTIAAVLLIPGLLVGSVFPYLMKISESWSRSAGKTIGQLASVNTGAAILGSLAAGFLLLNWLGLWKSLALVALLYLMMTAVVLWRPFRSGWRWPAAAVLLLLVIMVSSMFSPSGLGVVNLGADERLVWLQDGPHGTVAVILRGEDLRLKVNNHYLLGTAASTPNQRVQAWIPLSLHPDPRSVFFLGMGTGITAGGALDFPVERLVVTEINSDVIAASRSQFGPYLNGLFEDPRVTVVAEDGRTYLAGSREQFDVIIGDIFLTYRAGVGSLYTIEHFEAVRSRLAPGGIFAQWLPMFDLSEEEFGIIARTMLEVFPQVSLWRRSISPKYPVYALVATEDTSPLDPEALSGRFAELAAAGVVSSDLWLQNIPMAAFVGNLSAIRDHFHPLPISTDDRRPLEYLAPRTERDSKGSGEKSTLAFNFLARFCDRILSLSDPVNDLFLARVTDRGFREIEAGLEIYKHETYRRMGRAEAAQLALRRYQDLISEEPQASSTSR